MRKIVWPFLVAAFTFTVVPLAAQVNNPTGGGSPTKVSLAGTGTNANGTLAYTGSGLDDATITGTYNCSLPSDDYEIYIDSTGTPDTFGIASNQIELDNVPMTGSSQSLGFCGLSVTFGHTTGHASDDDWTATATATVTANPLTSTNYVGPATSSILNPDGSVTSKYFITQGFSGNLGIGAGTLQIQDATRPTPAHGPNYHNTGVGQGVFLSLTDGVHNSVFGTQVLSGCQHCSYNTGMGEVNLQALINGDRNTSYGDGGMDYIQTGSNNTCIGTDCMGGANLITASGNVAIGNLSGHSVVNPSNMFFLTNGAHSSNDETTLDMLYGVFGATAATTAGQYLKVNGGLQSGGTQSVTGCSITSAVGGAQAGSFHSGTTGTCTVTITPGFTATNGFSCWTNDMTTPADHIPQTAYNSTTATVSGTTVSGDVITWGCLAF